MSEAPLILVVDDEQSYRDALQIASSMTRSWPTA